MTFTICCRFHDKFVFMLEDILLQVYSDLNGFHGQSIKSGGFDEVFLCSWIITPPGTSRNINFTPVLFMSVYVIIKLYHQHDREYQDFLFWYTENSDAYLTNSERGIKRDKCLDTSKKRKNIDTWNYWCRNENWLLKFLVQDKVCSVEQWFLIRL